MLSSCFAHLRFLIAIVVVTGGLRAAERYAPPASPRSTYNFNVGWKFLRQDVAGADKADYNDASWNEVGLPHTWNDVDTYRAFIRHGGGDQSGEYMGIGWYRKHFKLPEAAKDGKVFLEFEGLKQAARFFINGKPCGKYENGVSPCGLDITDFVTFGDKENVIAVQVDNNASYREEATQTAFQWMTKDFNPNFGGLNRNAWLHLTGKIYQTLPLYQNLGTTGVYVYARNFDVYRSTAEVNVEAQVRNDTADYQSVTLNAFVVDASGVVRAKLEGNTSDLVGGQSETLTAAGQLSTAHFWECNDPYLYDVYSILTVNGKVVDVTKTHTGFRQTEFKGGVGTGGVFINGNFVWLTGYAQRSVDDWAGLGQAYPDWT